MDQTGLKHTIGRRPLQILIFVLVLSLTYGFLMLDTSLGTFEAHGNGVNSTTPYSSTPAPNPPVPALETIVFVLVMVGKEAALEGLVAMKTALMHVSRPTEFNILCDEEARPFLENTFALFSRPAYDVNIKLHLVNWELISERFVRAGVGSWHRQLVKTFLHEIFYQVDRAIFFDTDMMFLADPYLLWRRFEQLSDEVMASFPLQGRNTTEGSICSCIMLLNLAKMRQRTFMESTLYDPSRNALGTRELWDRYKIDPMQPKTADQTMYWAIWQRYPQYFTHLSLSWDTSHCRQSYGMGLNIGDDAMSEDKQAADIAATGWVQEDGPEKPSELFPAVIHYNCFSASGAWENLTLIEEKSPAWYPYVLYAVQYKWIWLNRGNGTATKSVSTTPVHHLYDEIYSQREMLGLE